MKNTHKILLVTAVAASFTIVQHASADGPYNPGLKNQVQTVPGVNNDPNLMEYPYYNSVMPPRTLQQRQELTTTENYNSHRDPNLLNQYAAVAGTPKQKDSALQDLEVAPLR
jgi:hypothetical protein